MINYLRTKCNLVNEIKQLQLKLHNQEEIVLALEEQIDKDTEELDGLKIELINLNNYTEELERKINEIKKLVQ